MAYLSQREKLLDKIGKLKDRGAIESDLDVAWCRAQIATIDRQMLSEELDRISRKKCYKTDGKTLDARLGADAWVSAFLPSAER